MKKKCFIKRIAHDAKEEIIDPLCFVICLCGIPVIILTTFAYVISLTFNLNFENTLEFIANSLVILFLFGFILFTIGCLIEYLKRVYDNCKEEED